MFLLFVLSGSAPVVDFLLFLIPKADLKEAFLIPPLEYQKKKKKNATLETLSFFWKLEQFLKT